MSDVESFIRNQVRRILLEKSETESTPKKKQSTEPQVVRGRVGGGNFSAEIRKVGGRLAEEGGPEQIVKELNITGASGRTDSEKIVSIINQARNSRVGVMREAYNESPVILQDESGAQFVHVKHNSELSTRDAAQYMYLLFYAAEKAGKTGDIGGKIIPGIVNAGEGEIVAILTRSREKKTK